MEEKEFLSFEIVSNPTLSRSLSKKLLCEMGRRDLNELIERAEQKEEEEKIKNRFDILDL